MTVASVTPSSASRGTYRPASLALVAMLAFGIPVRVMAAAPQDPASPAAQLKARFRGFDANGDGVLSGPELLGCGCREIDANRNGQVTWEEFRDGNAKASSVAPAVAPAPPTPASDRGSARSATGYDIPDRVEVNYDGVWYPGNIVGVQKEGRYQVARDDYTQDFKWLDASVIRPLARKKEIPRPRTMLPQTIPSGVYSCWTITSGFSSNNAMGSAMGDIRITGAGTYTGLSRNGVGPAGRFAFDPATGIILWGNGKVEGFFGTLTESTFAIDPKGDPVIDIVYRVRAGGNLFNLSCRKS